MSTIRVESREEAAIATLLDNRFGDGLVYIEHPSDRPMFSRARDLGLIDEAGLLTDEGFLFWRRRRDQLRRESGNAQGSDPYRLRCEEVWGGIANCDHEIRSSGLIVSLYSLSSRGGHGGDVYYVSLCEEDSLTRVVVADVVGHGEPVSHVSGFIYDALRAHRNDLDGGALLGSVNRLAVTRGLDAMTTAAVVGYYREEHTFYYAYAGHSPAFIRRRRDPRWMPAELQAPRTDTDRFSNVPLAVFENARFEQRSISLGPGDCVVLYTDGVVDAPSEADGRFGVERLRSVLDAHAGCAPRDLKRALVAALHRHAGGDLSHDDVTLAAIELC